MRETVPIQVLLASAIREGSGHMGRLLLLARVETDANLRAWFRLAGILGTIPILAIATFFLGLDAIVKMIAALFGTPLAAAAIVALPFVAVAVLLAHLGARRMALSNLEPWRTWRQAARRPPA